MTIRRQAAAIFAAIIIWLVVALGVGMEAFAIPRMVQDLSQKYTEYAHDQFTIALFEISIVLAGQCTLVFIALLLGRLRKSQFMNPKSLKWGAWLAGSLFAVAGATGALYGWLYAKNTLPGGLAIGLLLIILLAATAGFVTVALNGLLKDAIRDHAELEGVI